MTWRPKDLRLGAMRHRIDIQQSTQTQDEAGSLVDSWSNFIANEPASYEYTGGTERMWGRQLTSNINARFVIRYREGITTQMKVVMNGSSYGILHVNPVEGGKRYLELLCTQ